jgi:hypothetical protein
MSVSPTQLDLTVVQGTTLFEQVYWGTEQKAYKTITSIDGTGTISKLTFSSTTGVPEGWSYIVKNNSIVPSTEIQYAKNVTSSTIDLVNYYPALFSAAPTGGWGYIEYNIPFSLVGATAQCDIRDKNNTLLVSLTTANSGVIIDTTASRVTISTSATTTWTNDMLLAYSIQVTLITGQILILCYGNITVIKDATQ